MEGKCAPYSPYVSPHVRPLSEQVVAALQRELGDNEQVFYSLDIMVCRSMWLEGIAVDKILGQAVGAMLPPPTSADPPVPARFLAVWRVGKSR